MWGNWIYAFAFELRCSPILMVGGSKVLHFSPKFCPLVIVMPILSLPAKSYFVPLPPLLPILCLKMAAGHISFVAGVDMGNDPDFSDDSSLDGELEAEIVAKNEPLDMEFQSHPIYSRHTLENGSSSSGSNARSSLIGMGFSPSLVDKVIEEKGDSDVDLLLEALFASASIPEQKSDSSDSLDDLFDERDDASNTVLPDIHPKEEPDLLYGAVEEKKATLLSMDFTLPEVEFAVDKLGGEAPVHELVDFIFAARVAETSDIAPEDTVKCEEETTETMDKTLRLLEMGFSENEVSAAIDKFGSEMPISELAESIFSGQISNCNDTMSKLPTSNDGIGLRYENGHGSNGLGSPNHMKRSSAYPLTVKKEEPFDDFPSTGIDLDGDRKGKRVKQEDDFHVPSSPSDPSWMRTKINSRVPNRFQRPGPPCLMKSTSGSSLNKVVLNSPYFVYGNVVDLSSDSWEKVSKFLYAIHPEFANTQLFSALKRKEGYVHNLPTDNRLHLVPKSPVNIQEAIPETKRWWPSWDTRKQLTNISCETSGVYELCDRLGKTLINSYGVPSPAQQMEILRQCHELGLVWFGQNKLGPLEPEHLERILGYPLRHTQAAEWSLAERLQALKYCFQVDTLAYHLSVMRPLFPDGMVVLSIFSGIGGTEIALHRLGIPLKGVVSVETCPTKRKILNKWWHDTDQTGALVQIEGIEKLTTTRLEVLWEMLGGFDLVVCQNPCTNSAKGVRMCANGESLGAFDFSLFYEFVRVIQRVRSMLERRS
uniref:SAM-dependent MTase DRM-type domain-containing protein n=3 Tax=Kalanchoe fedtschenkoi TaxID=63787 RepID=A0A7N0T6G6_KALFE